MTNCENYQRHSGTVPGQKWRAGFQTLPRPDFEASDEMNRIDPESARAFVDLQHRHQLMSLFFPFLSSLSPTWTDPDQSTINFLLSSLLLCATAIN
jgi:hypothetical protein